MAERIGQLAQATRRHPAFDAVAIIAQQAQEARRVALQVALDRASPGASGRRRAGSGAGWRRRLGRAELEQGEVGVEQRRACAALASSTAASAAGSRRGCRSASMRVGFHGVRPVPASRPGTRCTSASSTSSEACASIAPSRPRSLASTSSTALSARPTANDSPLMNTCLPRYSIRVLGDSFRPRLPACSMKRPTVKRLGHRREEHVVLRLGQVFAQEDGDVFLVPAHLVQLFGDAGQHVARDLGRVLGRLQVAGRRSGRAGRSNRP